MPSNLDRINHFPEVPQLWSIRPILVIDKLSQFNCHFYWIHHHLLYHKIHPCFEYITIWYGKKWMVHVELGITISQPWFSADVPHYVFAIPNTLHIPQYLMFPDLTSHSLISHESFPYYPILRWMVAKSPVDQWFIPWLIGFQPSFRWWFLPSAVSPKIPTANPPWNLQPPPPPSPSPWAAAIGSRSSVPCPPPQNNGEIVGKSEIFPWTEGKHMDKKWMWYNMYNCQRKFRSQTSNNMDRWSSKGGSQRREERVRRKTRCAKR